MSRGMMKWAPYASLIEQKSHMEQMRYDRGKREKPLISNEKAEEINRLLTNYAPGSLLTFVYFYDGYIYQVKQSIRRIYLDQKRIIGSEKNLTFNQIVDIID